ncbi:MAG TPA: flagellar hook-length control protein FliK [Accumulibacter sp.]|jgi:flagellar hook-length control protein FliK|nr:flagellar hook-length control protein FliK [Accumulibacter sp.]HQC79386.1 flagellar hook-length control protein FliK [Accumulibacter sp.]
MSISIVSSLARRAQDAAGDTFRPSVAGNDTLDFASALAQSTANVLTDAQGASLFFGTAPLARNPADDTGQRRDDRQAEQTTDATSDASLNLAASLTMQTTLPPTVAIAVTAPPMPVSEIPRDEGSGTAVATITDADGGRLPVSIGTPSLVGSDPDPFPGKSLPPVAASTAGNTEPANTTVDPRPLLSDDSRPAPNTATTVAGVEQAAKFAVAPTDEVTVSTESHRKESPAPLSGLATLEAASNRIHGMTTATPDAPKELQTPLRDPAWNSEFGQKLLWFAHNDKQQAHLTLNPPRLGSIEITLNFDKDSASAYFASANPEVRNALETATPRLREMFAAAGIDLGQVGVGGESFREQPNNRQQRPSTHRQTADNAILDIDLASSLPTTGVAARLGSSRVDIFA